MPGRGYEPPKPGKTLIKALRRRNKLLAKEVRRAELSRSWLTLQLDGASEEIAALHVKLTRCVDQGYDPELDVG